MFMNQAFIGAHPYHAIDRVMRRKINKHVVEKKRRTRINSSLEQMKEMVLRARHQDVAEHDKMEKADILAMTVEHLHDLQESHQARSDDTRKSTRTGYEECLREVVRFCSVINLDRHINNRLVDHLHRHMRQAGLSDDVTMLDNTPQQQQLEDKALSPRPGSAPTVTLTPLSPTAQRPASVAPLTTHAHSGLLRTAQPSSQPRVAMIPPVQRPPVARVTVTEEPDKNNNTVVWRPF